jgi:hypothetical protein
MKLVLVLILIAGCQTTQLSDNREVIAEILADETIPIETRERVVRRLWENDLQAINVVYSKKEQLEKKVEKDAWKVSIINTILYILLFIGIAFGIKLLWKFRHLFGF